MAIDYHLEIADAPIDHEMLLAVLAQECPFTEVIPLPQGWQVGESFDVCGFMVSVWNEAPSNYWDITDMPQPDGGPSLNGAFVYTQQISFGMDKFYNWTRSLDKMHKRVSKILALTPSDVLFRLNDSTCFYRRQGVIYMNGSGGYGRAPYYQKYFKNYQVLG